MTPMRALVVVALSGCDGVFGLTDTGAVPCGSASFDGVPPQILLAADMASVNWDRDRAVVMIDGAAFEQPLPHGPQQVVDLGGYGATSLSLAPEGDALFYVAQIEPIELRATVKRETGWIPDLVLPGGTYAGTPSADEFGPRHVVVRLHEGKSDVQEYIAQDGAWVASGVPHPLDGVLAPNLTPSGLDVVYSGADSDGSPAVLAAHRSSVDVWFDPPSVILHGLHHGPQLLGRCSDLYVVDDDNPDSTPGQPPSTLRRYAL